MKILKEAYTIPNNVVMFYDRHLRLWTLYIKDEEGNQISNTEYAPSRTDAIEMAQDIDNFVIRESLEENALLVEEGPRGQTELRDFICELLNRLCNSTLKMSDYEIHHKDNYHDNNDPRNLVLLPKSNVISSNIPVVKPNLVKPNTSLHKRVGELDVFDSKSTDKYLNEINKYQAIDVYRSIRRQTITYLDNKLLKRDINVAKKNPVGRIR